MAEPVIRNLDAAVRRLFAPLLDDVDNPNIRVLGLDVEQGLSLVVEHQGRPILIEFEALDTARPCFLRTAQFNLNARLLFDRQTPLSEDDAKWLHELGAMVREREPLLDSNPRPTAARRSLLREIQVERVLMPEGRNQYYINPYVGCTIGCPFCYVIDRADLSRRLDGQPQMAWGRYVDVKVNAAKILRSELSRFAPGIVRMSPILTDPYQPTEARFRITRQCLEVLLEAKFTPVILTRARRVLEDLDLLTQFPSAAVGFSIPTDDDAIRQKFEPNADPIEARLEALRACRQAGLTTFVVIQPMLPMDAHRLVAETAPWICAARIDRMHQMAQSAAIYSEAQMEEAATDAFFERTRAALTVGFKEHGVPIDQLDDLAGLLKL
jgi:DNA repair photolyase